MLSKFLIFIFIISFLIANEYVIKFSHVVSPNTPKGKAAAFFAKRVEELSQGKIKVELYPNAILGKDNEVLRKMKLNAIQMAAPPFAKFSNIVPEFGVFSLPFLFKNEAHLHRVLDGKIGKELMKLVDEKGYIALAYWDNGFKQLTNSKRALIKPDDCRGLKFRIMNSKVLVEQFKTLKAIPVILPFSEVYAALSQGIVDGEENTISNIYTKNFYKVQKYMTISNHGYLGYVVLMSKKFWDSLPDDLKSIIKQAVKDATIKERIWAKELNKKQLEKIKKYAKNTKKLKIYYLTPKEQKLWKERLKSIYPKFYSTFSKSLIDKIVALENNN